MTRRRLYSDGSEDGRGGVEGDSPRRNPSASPSEKGHFAQAACPTDPKPRTPSEWSCWTALDQAELDVIIWTLVREYNQHKPLCEKCRGGQFPCSALEIAVNEMRDWIFGRQLKSRMEALQHESVYFRP